MSSFFSNWHSSLSFCHQQRRFIFFFRRREYMDRAYFCTPSFDETDDNQNVTLYRTHISHKHKHINIEWTGLVLGRATDVRINFAPEMDTIQFALQHRSNTIDGILLLEYNLLHSTKKCLLFHRIYIYNTHIWLCVCEIRAHITIECIR